MNDLWIASLLLLWVVVAIVSFLLAGALRQIGLLHMRLGNDPGALITDSGLDRGVQGPDFQAIDADSGAVVRFSEAATRASVLVFITPTCVSCREMISHLNEVFETRRNEFEFLVVCHGDKESCRSLARMNRLGPRLLIDPEGEVERQYEVALTPFAYLLDFNRTVLIRGVANDWRHFESLLEQEGTLQGGMAWASVDD